MVVENYCYITDIGKVGGKLYSQLVAEAVSAVFDLYDTSYKDAWREDVAETACFHCIANLEACMTWNVVEGGAQDIASLPVQIAKITAAPEPA